MTRADWYFDFVSPFAYLQSEVLFRFEGKLDIRPVPVLFAGLLKHWGQKGPAEMATKRRFTYRHVHWVAEQNGIPFRFPLQHPFNPVRALRAAMALGASMGAIHEIFRFIWREGRDVNAPAEWADPARFARGEYARLDALPVGAARKEVS